MRTKYVQVDRGSEYKNIYTTLRAAEHMVAAGTATGFLPVTLKQIKELRLHHYHEEDYFRRIEEHAFHTKYHGKRFQAKVIDGGPQSEMLVSVIGAEELHLQTIYACNIKGKKTWYPETACVFYEKGQIVDVEIHVTHGFDRFVIGLTPGHLDTEHWNRIKDSSLAFRCDDEGKAVTGLFK
jgi:hypothetical protein